MQIWVPESKILKKLKIHHEKATKTSSQTASILYGALAHKVQGKHSRQKIRGVGVDFVCREMMFFEVCLAEPHRSHSWLKGEQRGRRTVSCVTARECACVLAFAHRHVWKGRVLQGEHACVWPGAPAGNVQTHINLGESFSMTCLSVCVCVPLSGGLLGSDGGPGGGRVPHGAGVCLPAPQVWRGGLGSGRAAQRPLSPLCHSALRPHDDCGCHGFAADATAHPWPGVCTHALCQKGCYLSWGSEFSGGQT